MSRKHNTRHRRSRSHYPERLRARGLNKTPVMKTLELLRRQQLSPDELRTLRRQDAPVSR